MGIIGIATAIKNRRGKEEGEEEIPRAESDAAAAEILRQTEDALAQLEIDPTPAEEAPQAASGENGEPSTLDFSDSIPAYEAAPEGARFDPSLIVGGEVAPPPDVLAASSPRLGVQPDAGVDWMGTAAAAEPPPEQERPAPVAAPPPIVLDGFREVTGQPQVPISGADLPATQAPPPQSPAAAQGPSVPRSYLEYQQARARAQRQDRARMAVQQILRLVGGATALGMAGADNPRGAAIANAATRLAAGAVPDADRVQRAQQEYGIARQVEADQRSLDADAARVVAAQERSDIGRERLAEQMRHNRAIEARQASEAESRIASRGAYTQRTQQREEDRRSMEVEVDSEAARRARSQLQEALNNPAIQSVPEYAAWAEGIALASEGWTAQQSLDEINDINSAIAGGGSHIARLARRQAAQGGGGGGPSRRDRLALQLVARRAQAGDPVIDPATGQAFSDQEAAAAHVASMYSTGDLVRELRTVNRTATRDAVSDADRFLVREIPGMRVTNEGAATRLSQTQVERLMGNAGNYSRMLEVMDDLIRWRAQNPNGTTNRAQRGYLRSRVDDLVSAYSGMQGAGALGEAEGERYRRGIGEVWNPDLDDTAVIGRLLGTRQAIANMWRNRYQFFGYTPIVPDAPARLRGMTGSDSGGERRDPETNERISSPAQRGRGPSRGDMVTIRVTTASGQTAERTVSRDRVQQYRRAAEANGGTVEEVR